MTCLHFAVTRHENNCRCIRYCTSLKHTPCKQEIISYEETTTTENQSRLVLSWCEKIRDEKDDYPYDSLRSCLWLQRTGGGEIISEWEMNHMNQQQRRRKTNAVVDWKKNERKKSCKEKRKENWIEGDRGKPTGFYILCRWSNEHSEEQTCELYRSFLLNTHTLCVWWSDCCGKVNCDFDWYNHQCQTDSEQLNNS